MCGLAPLLFWEKIITCMKIHGENFDWSEILYETFE